MTHIKLSRCISYFAAFLGPDSDRFRQQTPGDDRTPFPDLTFVPWPEGRPRARVELLDWAREHWIRLRYDYTGYTWPSLSSTCPVSKRELKDKIVTFKIFSTPNVQKVSKTLFSLFSFFEIIFVWQIQNVVCGTKRKRGVREGKGREGVLFIACSVDYHPSPPHCFHSTLANGNRRGFTARWIQPLPLLFPSNTVKHHAAHQHRKSCGFLFSNIPT